jgi:hypothetical protein
LRRLATLINLLVPIGFSKSFAVFFQEIKRRVYSNETVSLYQYDLTQSFVLPVIPIPLTVRQLRESDLNTLLSLHESDGNLTDLRNRLERLLLFRVDIPTCYVGVTSGDIPCVMCWLINYTSNDKLQDHFKGGIMPLKSDEVLCENIYTHKAYLGMRLMQYLTLHLFEKAAQNGARKAFAYIKNGNTSSLRASKAIGWKSCGSKINSWRLFRRSIRFEL